MTDSRDPGENIGEMDPRFENIAGYVLGALDNEDERAAVEALIESDRAAQAEFIELAEATGLLAAAVPPIEPPAVLKTRILEQAAEELRADIAQLPAATAERYSQKPRGIARWTQALQTGYAVSAAAAVIVLIAAGTLGIQNSRLTGKVDTLRSELGDERTAVANLRTEVSTTLADSETAVASMKSELNQMENDFGATTEMIVHQEKTVSELAAANTALRQALRDQSWLAYVATKEGYQVESWLSDYETASNASGVIAVQVVGNEAVFQVLGLPQPEQGYTYTLWLLGNGKPMPVSQFEVSEIGSASFPFMLPAPFYRYSSLAVTQEPVNGIGPGPSGVKFLSAETE